MILLLVLDVQRYQFMTENRLLEQSIYQRDYRSGLFRMTSAAITPGTQPQSHKRKTIKIEPQPLSRTDKGGKKIASKTRQILMLMIFN